MGFWSKVKKGWDAARVIAPVLPIPAKAKVVIDKAGHAEDDIKEVVRAVKPAPKEQK